MYDNIKEFLCSEKSREDMERFGIYPDSFHKNGNITAFMVRGEDEDLLTASFDSGFHGEEIEVNGEKWIVCPKDHLNAKALRRVFPFTSPRAVLGESSSMGLGDRLGIAAPGHLHAISGTEVYPVLAQQSMRELNLTHRTFEDVLDCASFFVFREGYKKGFGADGDHLKKKEDIRTAISCGYTMITLDCSEYIRGDALEYSDEKVLSICEVDKEEEEFFCSHLHMTGEYSLEFSKAELCRANLIYNDALRYTAEVYEELIKGSKAELELSIDETSSPTLPVHHYYIASKLRSIGVEVKSVAPRFIGEFQKGIDYIGDIKVFEEQFAVHAAIAESFGYKLSIHSGSDKFSVFPIIEKYTRGKVHLKTAGTNWLEAMKIIAKKDPGLYRRIHDFALKNALEKAKAFYHVDVTEEKVPQINDVCDEKLYTLLENDMERQLIHITYGFILDEKEFNEKLFSTWRKHDEEYAVSLAAHIKKHLRTFTSSLPVR